MLFRHGVLTRRDAFLLLVGASSMHIWSLLFSSFQLDSGPQSIVINTHLSPQDAVGEFQLPNGGKAVTTTKYRTHIEVETQTQTLVQTRVQTQTQTQTTTATATVTQLSTPQATPHSRSLSPRAPLPPTEILAHAPGWTLFRDVYMSNGTLYIVSDGEDGKSGKGIPIPEIRMMTSTGLAAENTPENIAAREPTEENMRVVSRKEAERRWGAGGVGAGNRVWTVEGNTLLFNDPSQFLRHYYHFVAELFFGVQVFWHSFFSGPIPPSALLSASDPIHYQFTNSNSTQQTQIPPMHRAIFAHSNADGWRDNPGFDAYFLRAAFPSLVVEHQEDWTDRIKLTRPRPSTAANANTNGDSKNELQEKAWHFPILLLTDRSAAHRGWMCGSNTQRTAAEAWEYMRVRGRVRGMHVGGWWAPVREAVWRFAGVGGDEGSLSSGLSSSLASASETGAGEVEGHHQQAFTSEITEIRAIDAEAHLKIDPDKIANVGVEHQRLLPLPEKIVIGYISRQSARNRKLVPEDHEELVRSLRELVGRKNEVRKEVLEGVDKASRGVGEGDGNGEKRGEEGEIPLEWELNVIEAEGLSHDEQIRAAERTSIMLGVHGNGLTHLIFMKPTRVSTVIEMFYPMGFAHDYYWTARALGMSHFAVWNDTHHSYPNKPNVDYPEGFQGNKIPAHGPSIAKLIEDRVAGLL